MSERLAEVEGGVGERRCAYDTRWAFGRRESASLAPRVKANAHFLVGSALDPRKCRYLMTERNGTKHVQL